ncbi:uncharacterized protein EI90DRAFT_3285804 [Cantharellus anzutake]|uniref:uncharacterized protein n=1 Tax=Cantharellus anzutake TaxID=1750568 RepID=UPI0019070412|nr:uncharacterized protein EI90DRAFT_3285804 [Cantharellus anzutake]KAF8340394.1 hypothetical protein EI90DRAFT_3285804 [Cantharellus anzutake]
MALIDRIKDAAQKFIPERKPIGQGPGMVPFDDEMPISKPAIIFHASQMFFAFLAMCCFASVASFQAKWNVGPSGLSGLAVFVAVTNLLLAVTLILVPVLYDKYNKLANLARAFSELRVGFILAGIGLAETFLISFVATISAWTEAGCKDPNKDPHAKSGGDAFKKALPGWCRTKKAGAIFFWLGTIFWICSVVLLVLDWRSGRSERGLRPRDPPFRHPSDPNDDDAESMMSRQQSRRTTARQEDAEEDELESPFSDPYPRRQDSPYRYQQPAARVSMDTYGAFSDPLPSGYTNAAAPSRPSFSSPPPQLPPLRHPGDIEPPRYQQSDFYRPPQPPQGMSRTMALAYEDTGTTEATYDDPYDRVKANLESARPRDPPSAPSGYR